MIQSSSIAIIFYLAAASYQALSLIRFAPIKAEKRWLLALGAIAVTAHAFSALGTIYQNDTVDLGFFSVSSLIFWFVATITLLSALRRPLDNLFIILFPLASLSILVAHQFAPAHAMRQALSAGIVVHILSSILAYSVLTIAAIQAIALALQVHELKHRHIMGILQSLPPLQTMEKMLFEIIWIGLLLLSCSIISGALYIEDIFAQHLIHKTTLTIAAWFIFATLLWGRHQLGWRSQTAVRWTLGGFVALMLAYFGSKLVLELILDKL